MAFSKIDGITLHWHVVGPQERPAIVFSNSLGADWRIWDRTTMLLENRYRIVTYDKRGHGLSDAPKGPYTINDHANDLLAVADLAGAERFAVVGISVGGLIAQQVVAQMPARVSALVLCDTAAKIGTAESWAGRIASIQNAGLASIADGLMERWFSKQFRQTRKAELAGWRNMLTRTPVDGYIATCEALRDADLTLQATKIGVPTLVVTGDEDGSTPPDVVRAMANLIAGARFEIIKQSGHLPCIEQPEALAALIAGHLQEAGHV